MIKPHLYKQNGVWRCCHPIIPEVVYSHDMCMAYWDWYYNNVDYLEEE